MFSRSETPLERLPVDPDREGVAEVRRPGERGEGWEVLPVRCMEHIYSIASHYALSYHSL